MVAPAEIEIIPVDATIVAMKIAVRKLMGSDYMRALMVGLLSKARCLSATLATMTRAPEQHRRQRQPVSTVRTGTRLYESCPNSSLSRDRTHGLQLHNLLHHVAPGCIPPLAANGSDCELACARETVCEQRHDRR